MRPSLFFGAIFANPGFDDGTATRIGAPHTHEASGGLVLIVSSAAALALANSAASELYAAVLAHKVAGLSVLHWFA